MFNFYIWRKLTHSGFKTTHLILLTLAIHILLAPHHAVAQKKKIDLDDLMVKGELHSDGQLRLINRQRNDVNNFVRFRKNYRTELGLELPSEKGLELPRIVLPKIDGRSPESTSTYKVE
jgi:hypothetical protein